MLESASLGPLEHLVFFPILPLIVSLLSIYGGLKWLRPKWRTQFLQFADVPTEVVTIVISDFINKNIFSCPINVHLNMNIVSIDIFNCLYIIEYICHSSSNTLL